MVTVVGAAGWCRHVVLTEYRRPRFAGYCDGAQQAAEQHGVRVRLTPDIPRGYPLEMAELTARHAVAYRDRGVVGIGLGGPEAEFPPEPFARAFEIAPRWRAWIGAARWRGGGSCVGPQRGALCDARTRSELQQIGDACDWPGSARDAQAPSVTGS